MNISQEILVLDFGDDKNHDFFKSEASADFGKGAYLYFIYLKFLINKIFFLL